MFGINETIDCTAQFIYLNKELILERNIAVGLFIGTVVMYIFDILRKKKGEEISE